MADMSVFSEESTWLVALIVIGVAVAVIFFGISPQIRTVTFSFLCNTFYDLTYYFFGPRPPIELCGPSSGANISSSAPAKVGGT